MAFDTDLTLVGTGAVDHVYSQISLQDRKSIRQMASKPLGTPCSLTLAHSTKGNGMTATDRHLVRLDEVKEDTGSDDIATLSQSVYLVLETPRRIFDEADVQNSVDQLVDFITTAGVLTKILNSEP